MRQNKLYSMEQKIELHLASYKVLDISFKMLKAVNKLDSEVLMGVSSSGKFFEEDSMYRVTLDFDISDKDEKIIDLKMLIQGVYTYADAINIEDKDTRVDVFKEAVYSLYPYARAAISSITAAAGMSSVIIPALDYRQMSDLLLKKTTDSDEPRIVV